MTFKAKTKEETIRGYVVPTDWDNDDNVIEISIQTDNDDFVVDQQGLGRELMDFIDHDVEVTGMVQEDRHGAKTITVVDYEMLSEEDSEEDFADTDDWDIDFGNSEGRPPF